MAEVLRLALPVEAHVLAVLRGQSVEVGQGGGTSVFEGVEDVQAVVFVEAEGGEVFTRAVVARAVDFFLVGGGLREEVPVEVCVEDDALVEGVFGRARRRAAVGGLEGLDFGREALGVGA